MIDDLKLIDVNDRQRLLSKNESKKHKYGSLKRYSLIFFNILFIFFCIIFLSS